ncbi:hypothetical protein PINS_up014619 [Pythium insidiosum]|nr:hypothetical protein PINS_up014619 [Pythium insidiosum]
MVHVCGSCCSQFPPSHEKRYLFETLSGMHPARVHSRLPIKMTQDRSRERRMKEARRVQNETMLSQSSSGDLKHSKSWGPNSTDYSPDNSNNNNSMGPDRLARSCPNVKWRSSSAIVSTIRLAHSSDVEPPATTGSSRNILSYDNKKPTNRYNHMRTTPSVASGNSYLDRPVGAGASNQDDDYPVVLEL